MKILLYCVLTLIFSACCLMGNKCDSDDNMLNFRILNTNGEDLLFGKSKKYDKKEIKIYSLNAGDTLFQNFGTWLYTPNSSATPDTILIVTFNYASRGPIFVQLNSSDIDTLHLNYQSIDGGRCCGEYKVVHAGYYNDKVVQESNGVSILEK